MPLELEHGGTDALGVPLHDFSTNRNACGPCPQAVAALHAADSAQYPDPAYTALRAQLAAFHGVTADRVLIAGSASEWIHRISMHASRAGCQRVTLPAHHYGDYAHAAATWGLELAPRSCTDVAGLHWACAPSSPLGQEDGALAHWQALALTQAPQQPAAWHVLDCAYAPLRLSAQKSAGTATQMPQHAHLWQMWTPNKALGMTGIRAAYVIAPLHAQAHELAALRALAPSWVVGAHGVAMLHAWTQPQVQAWLAQSLQHLHTWKQAQLALCEQLGWQVVPGHQANYFVAQLPQHCQGDAMAQLLLALRAQGIKLRDCRSFGLPGHVRLGVLPPASQQALAQAWRSLVKKV